VQAYRLAALSVIVLYASAAPGPLLKDLQGRQVAPISEGISVLLFTRTDCPISNRYAPEIARIYKLAQPAGARFWLVYVDPKESVDALQAHMREYAYPFNAVVDSRHELVKLSGAKVTPEVAVYSSGRLIYRGRIDNRYVSPGTARSTATVRDLEDVLTEAVKGQQVQFRSTAAVGCFIEDLR
jgi:AhpC/TSA family